MKRKTRNIILGILTIIGLVFGGLLGYLSDSYPPTEEAIQALKSSPTVRVVEKKDYQAFIPEEGLGKTGLIFYPGGKVDADAYAPLLKRLAEEGIASYLVKMPFNLAVLNSKGADQVIETEKDVEDWYLAGHSLGGAMAASYAANHPDELTGLILLAAYSTKDLSRSNLAVLSIYGGKDEVLDLEKYQENRSLVPQMQELFLEGGNHAQFGDYGRQVGDGPAEMTADEQIEKTVEAIRQFVKNKE